MDRRKVGKNEQTNERNKGKEREEERKGGTQGGRRKNIWKDYLVSVCWEPMYQRLDTIYIVS